MAMKSNNLLLEFKASQVSDQLATKLDDHAGDEYSDGTSHNIAWRQSKQDTVNNIISVVLKIDPSRNKKNVLWILQRYANRELLWDDVLSTLAEDLEKYEFLKRKNLLPQKFNNIFNFKNLPEFYATIQAIYHSLPEEVNDHGNSIELVNNNNVRVIVPLDALAAKYYGRGTAWCTAANKNNQYRHYASHGRLFIVIPKHPRYNGEKYQLFFGPNTRVEFKDELDIPVDNNRTTGYTSLNDGAVMINKPNSTSLLQEHPDLLKMMLYFAKKNSNWADWLKNNK